MVHPQSLIHDACREVLEIIWDDQSKQHLAAARLRAGCQCADCKSLRRSGEVPALTAGIGIRALRPVGAYGVQIVFSDGHERGIYPWAYLKGL